MNCPGYPTNHAGVGYHEYLEAEFVDGKRLPNTEETGRRITDPRGKYRPMAFGPIGRAWQPRPKYAGTYDQKWLDDVFPFLPADFKEDYYQAAPVDQQTDGPVAGTEVELVNLTPKARTWFSLPTIKIPIVFKGRDSKFTETQASLDTLVIEPDLDHFTVCWRSSLPLRKNFFEISHVLAGLVSPGWHRAMLTGKTYFRSLDEMIKHSKESSDEPDEEFEA